MTRVFFSKKHIIISAVIALVLATSVLIFWLFLLNPKRAEGIELAQELAGIEAEIRDIQEQLVYLQGEPDLLSSETVNEVPIIPNGMAIESYFTDLAALETELPITILQSTFNEEMLYPTPEQMADQTGDNPLATQFRVTRIGFDLLSDTNEGIVRFIDRMENLNRFLKVESVEYRQGNNTSGADAFSASVVIKLYYLSSFETGQELLE
ncbi:MULTISPECIES: hypothetical protein [Enterococcus]|jgi:hypothetical protein|uniref:hypothetical protein n=1 Tax=Enterococcus TaxID=1350 RepID=UPI0003547A66|nr:MULTISPECIES: hypothetical protein [Enterococcus]MBN2904961.1 hypothetical protein [Enterococcus sp.]EPH61800.1 hypothetical protein D932_02812 [Enterococcus casseliflavus 14-MB-W-14]MDB1688155.1 hypothetical protein [Enterococcus casseliflavus]MDB1691705.1 hypothetical protein [Enterococcus casseliflavus]MDO7872719.1 hypothetical protein [Enterococcus casseliflavus]